MRWGGGLQITTKLFTQDKVLFAFCKDNDYSFAKNVSKTPLKLISVESISSIIKGDGDENAKQFSIKDLGKAGNVKFETVKK